MPVPTETYWNTRKVGILFAVSSVALLGSLVWMVKVDYAKQWRMFQENFIDTQRSLAHFDVLTLQTDEARNELSAGKTAVARAQSELAAQQALTQRVAGDLRGGHGDFKKIAEEIAPQIGGPHHAAFATRARHIDPEFGKWIEEHGAKPDAAALSEHLGNPRFAQQMAELLDWFNLTRLDEADKKIRGDHARAELVAKNLKSEKGVLEAAFEHEKGLRGVDHPETREIKTKLDALQARYQAAKVKFDTLADERHAIEEQRKLLQVNVTDAQRSLARLEKVRNDALKKYEDLSNTLSRGIFNLPLLDFAAPKGTSGRNEIKQVVLPDVRVELNFLQSYATDRCMTCHVAIADKAFTKENLAKRLEQAIIGANEEFRRSGTPPLKQPTIPGRPDLQPGRVALGWQSLTPDQQDKFFHQLVDQINIYQARQGEAKLDFGEPLWAHPNLDLYISADSPHPMSKMGCTVCHEGNGEETDFVLAGHTPKSKEERETWEKKYYTRTAGLVPEIDFETAEHHWTRPMHPRKLAQAGCTKCHSQVSDIATYAGKPSAQRINEGQLLFVSLGCINCHLVEQFGDSRKVGPDLSHLGEKTTRGFVQNWIYFPADYRPSTNMPHFFGQENNDAQSERAGGDSDPVTRTKAEVVALTEYLMRVSNGYKGDEPPADLWEPLKDENADAIKASRDRGRRLFGSVGCLACHANLAYQPNDQNGAPIATTLGEQWIAGDLASKLEALVHGVQEAKARQIKAQAIEDARKEGKDPKEVTLKGMDKIDEQLAVAAEGGELPLPKFIEFLRASFTGSPTEGQEHAKSGTPHVPQAKGSKKPAASAPSGGSEQNSGADQAQEGASKLAGVHYDAAAALRHACEELLKSAEPAPSVALTGEDREAITLPEDIHEAINKTAHELYGTMNYSDRVDYSMTNFKNAYDTLFDPQQLGNGPIFTRFAPELSSIGTKFESYDKGVHWLYDWLKNPRHYSEYTKMPRLRLKRDEFPEINPETGEATGQKVDADEALDLAIYLIGLKANEQFSTKPFNAEPLAEKKLAAQRDAMIKNLLGGLNSDARSTAILNDEGGELSDQLISKLTRSLGESEARSRIEALDLEQRRWVFLGDKMVGHYGCYACHLIRGYETAARPGTELTNWGEKQLTQIDFAFFDPNFREEREKDPLFRNLYPENREKLIRWAHHNPEEEVEHNLASFAWHKVRNPRIWDRHKAKAPYEKLKMPNFFLTDNQADALVTFLLSRRPPRVNKVLQADYENGPAGKIARGRNLVRELNCVACHKIDGNAAVVQQYFQVTEGGETSFDEINAPPWLHGEGAKVQSGWLFSFLNNVEMLRPWLRIRMPSFHLTQEQSTRLVEFFFGSSQRESKWLAAHLAPVDRYMESAQKQVGLTVAAAAPAGSREGGGDVSEKKSPKNEQPGANWFEQESLSWVTAALRRYSVEYRLVQPSAVDPATNQPDELSATYAKIFTDTTVIEKLYNVPYPFPESPVLAGEDTIHDGGVMFDELKCLACHVFGDPKAPGANAAPTAPNLQLAHKRLRHEWVNRWLQSPQLLQPGTKMPNVFGTGNRTSAFADFPPEAKEKVAAQLIDKALVDDGDRQIQALIAFLYDAGEKRLNKVRPPEATGSEPAQSQAAESAASQPADAASSSPAADASKDQSGGASSAPANPSATGTAPADK